MLLLDFILYVNGIGITLARGDVSAASKLHGNPLEARAGAAECEATRGEWANR